MKKRLTAMLAGLVLASGMGAASAAGVPEILGSVDSSAYQAMSNPELDAVQGEDAFAFSASAADAAGQFVAVSETATATLAISVPGVVAISQSRALAASASF